VHARALLVALNSPVAHAAHTRSVVVVPAALMYVPASQVRNVLHVVTLVASLNVPLAHSVQVRSREASGATLT
jgi:hypothetical protein